MAKKIYQDESLSALEDGLVDLVRLGVAGDAASVSQLGRRILRRHADDASNPGAFREALGAALVAVANAPMRAGTRLEAPTDSESKLPLVRIETTVSAPSPLLVEAERLAIERLIEEHTSASVLEAAGLAPTRSILISGPPGVGKTMTARHIATTLELPLVTMDLAGLMSSFLGRTGQNLRHALDYARSFRCVLLLDEFDALAKRRDDSSDVGELKRIVNVLLQELERWPVANLLIAATNHPELLDRAIGRRFDSEVELSLPDTSTRSLILRRTLTELGQAATANLVAAAAVATEGWSGSDLDRLVKTSVRRAVLEDAPIEVRLAHDVLEPLRVATKDSRPKRAAFCAIAVNELGMTQREVAEMLGVTHPTVGKLIKEWSSNRPLDETPVLAGRSDSA